MAVEIKINSTWCKACGICYEVCPRGVLAPNEVGKATVAAGDKCTSCKLCENLCPDFAIEIGGARVA